MTAPLVPAHVDLRDFEFLPLSAVRLRDSQLAIEATGDEFRAAVLLWCASWHQVPAASLPDDDRALATYAGYGRVVKEWKRVRDGALRGFVRCDDGRLYHPILSEKAREAWIGKLRTAHRRECERIKKAAQRAKVDPKYPAFEDWLIANDPTFVPRDTTWPSLGTAPECPEGPYDDVPGVSLPLKGEGEGEGDTKEPTTSGGEPPQLPVKSIYDRGLKLLVSTGTLDKPARSFLGQLRKDIGDVATIALIDQCIEAEASDPIPWLARAAQNAKTNGSIRRGNSARAGAIGILEGVKQDAKAQQAEADRTLDHDRGRGGDAALALPLTGSNTG